MRRTLVAVFLVTSSMSLPFAPSALAGVGECCAVSSGRTTAKGSSVDQLERFRARQEGFWGTFYKGIGRPKESQKPGGRQDLQGPGPGSYENGQ